MQHKILLASSLLMLGMSAAMAKQVDAFYYDLSDPFVASIRTAIDAEGKAQEITVKHANANDDPYTQIVQLEACDYKNPVLVNLVDRNYGAELLKKAAPHQTRVVFFNRDPGVVTLQSYPNAFFVGSDSMAGGRLQGKMILDYLKAHPECDRNHDGVINAVLFKGDIGHSASEQRMQNAISVLRSGGIELRQMAVLRANWSESQATEQLTNLLIKVKPEDVELILSNNDAMAIGALHVLKSNGYNQGQADGKYIPVFGFDGLDQAIEAVNKGELAGTVRSDYQTRARVTLKIALSASSSPDQLTRETGYPMDTNRYVMVPYQSVIKDQKQ